MQPIGVQLGSKSAIFNKMSKRKNVDSDSSTPSGKKTKRTAHYRPDHTKEWPFIQPGCKGDEFVYCGHCECDISVKNGGRNDIERHIETGKHKDAEKIKNVQDSCKKISSMFVKTNVPLTRAVSERVITKAEMIFVDLVTECNLQLATLDKIMLAVKEAFQTVTLPRSSSVAATRGLILYHQIACKLNLLHFNEHTAEHANTLFPILTASTCDLVLKTNYILMMLCKIRSRQYFTREVNILLMTKETNL